MTQKMLDFHTNQRPQDTMELIESILLSCNYYKDESAARDMGITDSKVQHIRIIINGHVLACEMK